MIYSHVHEKNLLLPMIRVQKVKMGFLLEFCLLLVALRGVNIQAKSLNPQLFTHDDARHYMDATATADSHEFEIVSPMEVEEFRQRRGADEPFGMSQFKFQAFGEDFHLQVATNRHLTAKGLAVQYVDAKGNVEERPLPVEHQTCYKIGRVLSHKGASRVAVSTCNNGLSGIVKVESSELFIRKLTNNHTDSVRRHRRDIVNPHIVYRRTAGQSGSGGEGGDGPIRTMPQTHFCGLERYFNFVDVARERLSALNAGRDADTSGRRKREATCSVGSTKILELMIVIDAEMNNYHGPDSISYTLTLMNTVASSFMHESLGVPLIVKIVQMRVLQSNYIVYGRNSVLNVTPEGVSTLTSFCQYQSYLNSPSYSDPNHFDNAVLLTRYNLIYNNSNSLLGIAHLLGTCNRPYSCALVEELGYGSGQVITHELGHNLGMEHDGFKPECPNGVNIMSSSRTAGPGSFAWSICSKNQLNRFLCHQFSECLNDNISGGETRELDPSYMPGVTIDGNAQCQVIDSQATGTCSRFPDICGHLVCAKSSYCFGTGVPALDGTACGDGKWCLEGTCVNKPGVPTQVPVDGGWSGWTEYACSVTCGQGTRTRTRLCNNPPPQNGGQSCPGSNTETVTCNLQACPVSQPIDGGWSDWQYGACSTTCGDGFLEGTRECNEPAPQNGGADCVGLASVVFRCRIRDCPNVINGGWSDWSYQPCSRSCGGGTQTRTRTCDNPEPQNGGSVCVGNSQQEVGCNTQACPVVVDGEWSSWSTGPCSQTCGTGIRTRFRSCNNPPPQNNGQYCPGSNTDVVSCQNPSCTVDGGWSSWGSFSSCSVTCGQGLRTRTRSCTNPAPSSGGQQCAGSSTGYQICTVTPLCPVDGGWSEWQPFSPCSVTCGTGRRWRSRTCTDPSPQNNGQTCPGSNIEYQNCNRGQACQTPINGGWSPWQPYGACSVTCGRGQQTRTRSCTQPAPQNGGLTCSGPATDGRDCINADCPTQNPPGEVTGSFVGGVYRAYTRFLTIPVGASDVSITNRGAVTFMDVEDGDNFLLNNGNFDALPSRDTTEVSHRGMVLVHEYGRVETLSIAGPTTVALEVGVFLFLNPASFGPIVSGNVAWSYRPQPQWVRTPGTCSVTCGTGYYIEVIRCASVTNGQQVFYDDESHCSHQTKPSPRAQACNEAQCQQNTRWRLDTLDCTGLCGEAMGTRNVYCTSSITWTVVPDEECDPQQKPPTTAPCQDLPPCVQDQPTGSCQNFVVSSQGSINRMLTSTGGETCGYTIVAPPGSVIRVQLVNYLIDCDNGEELVFKDGFRSADHCTRTVSPGTTDDSQSNIVQIEHKTTQNGHGYHIIYSFIYRRPPGDCDETLLESPGTLQSPSYPNYYANDQRCRYFIVAPANMKIVLTFNELSLYNLCDETDQLKYDYIAFQDFEQNGNYRPLCGTSTEPSRVSHASVSNRLLVTFRSDPRNNSRGFHASYTFVPRT